MSIQRVITDDCAEQTTVRWDGERLAIIWLQHRPQMPSTHVARILNPREAHELADFIRANVARPPEMLAAAIAEYNHRWGLTNSCTPGCPSAPMQADVQDGDNPPPKTESKGVAGDLDRQPATNMNWEEVRKCNIWRELGVSECAGCPGNSKCWTASQPNNREV